jgi:hypothetical protein
MLTHDPLFESRQRCRQLRAEAAAERLRPLTARRRLAGTLRRVADRVDPGPVVIPLDCSNR